MTSRNDEQLTAVLRENARLVQQTRKLQEVVASMRDEIADANAEIAASKRLAEEQKHILLLELQRERAQREALDKRLQTMHVEQVSVGTNTATEVSTSTVSDAQTMTSSGVSPPRDGGYAADAPSSSMRYYRQEAAPPLIQAPPTPSSSWQRTFMRQKEPRRIEPSEVQQFAQHLCHSVQFYGVDLCSVFESMGAASVGELCATITERDLIAYGVPLVKARGMMHVIMETTAALLQQGGHQAPHRVEYPQYANPLPAAMWLQPPARGLGQAVPSAFSPPW